jgi:phosphatidate cytidylyltransferase
MARILSAAVLLPIVVGAVWFLGPLPLLAVTEIVLVLAFVEYAGLAARLEAPIARVPAGVTAACVCAAVAVPGVPIEATLAAALIAVAAVAVGAGAPQRSTALGVAAGLFPALYLGLPLGTLVAVHSLAGREAALLLLATVIVSDTAQFYTGSLVGRTPLAPAISPKKTVEGAIGGLVAGTATLTVIGHWWLPAVGASWRVGLGLVVVALGILGDLFESLLKRSAGVKDSSGLVPGHGGMLDRIDALLFAAPAYFILLRYGPWLSP